MLSCAYVAQSVAHRLGKAEVTGSSPVISSKFCVILNEFGGMYLNFSPFLFSIVKYKKGNNRNMSKKIIRNTTYNIAVYGSTVAVLLLGMALFIALGFVVKGGVGVAMFVFAGLVGAGTIATLLLSIFLKDKVPQGAEEAEATLVSYDRFYIPRLQKYGYILTFQHDGGDVVYHSSVRCSDENLVSQMRLGQNYPVLIYKHKVYIASEKLYELFANNPKDKIEIVDYYDDEEYDDFE